MLWYGQLMNSLIASCVIIGIALVFLFTRGVFEYHRKTIEMIIRSHEDFSSSLNKAHSEMLDHLKNAAPIGGLPRDLWLEQHELKSRELTLREEQLAIEAPLRKQALEHRLRKSGRLAGSGRISNPEN